jgi:hypothetical protein
VSWWQSVLLVLLVLLLSLVSPYCASHWCYHKQQLSEPARHRRESSSTDCRAGTFVFISNFIDIDCFYEQEKEKRKLLHAPIGR